MKFRCSLIANRRFFLPVSKATRIVTRKNLLQIKKKPNLLLIFFSLIGEVQRKGTWK